MSQLASTLANRYDPYKNYKFLVYFATSAAPVAGVSGVGPVRRYSDVIEYRSGDNRLVTKGLGRTHYDAVELTRGVTQDTEFEAWANAAQVLTNGSPSTSLANLRQHMSIVLLNEQGQAVRRYNFYQCWVSEYQALPFLDAETSMTAFERIRVENEGWERDLAVVPPTD
jgi:phage tail-like protein